MKLTLAMILSVAVLRQQDAAADSAMSSLPFPLREPLAKRAESDEKGTFPSDECLQMKNEPGDVIYISPGEKEICSLFIVAGVNQIISLSFTEFDVGCHGDGFLEVTDGWEINDKLFPSPIDYQRSADQRFASFCGENKPRVQFKTSQNVAMLKYRIPAQGQRFGVRVEFHTNYAPCNVVSMDSEGSTTIQNYGDQVNCSVLIVYPAEVKVIKMDVGHPNRIRRLSPCEVDDQDYLEVLGGSQVDTTTMTRSLMLCNHVESKQRDLQSARHKSDSTVAIVNQPYTAIRLVSSGRYDNTATVHYKLYQTPDYE